jgi:uncharacterized phage protein (TIGR01671 family)
MREIKFRYWDLEYKDWVELPALIGDYQADSYRTYSDPFPMSSFMNGEYQERLTDGLLVIQQYTGLKDQNGVEIYEGDIVEWGMSLDQINPFPKLRYVEFCERQLIYKVVEVGDLPSSLDYLYEAAPMSTRWCRVVGSIHENPELIEQWVEN